MIIKQKKYLKKIIENYIENKLKIIDFHTHIFPSAFNDYYLDGIENILNYHYLHAEYLKLNKLSPKEFFSLSSHRRAKKIWNELFLKRIPFSEATKGVITILNSFNISSDLKYKDICIEFSKVKSKEYLKKVYKLSNVSKVVMTNDIFDVDEIKFYDSIDKENFYTSIRLDSYFTLESKKIEFNNIVYDLKKDISKYLLDLTNKLKPLYFAISVDEKFSIKDKRYIFLEKYIFSIAKQYNIPISLMIGVKRGVNKEYKLAGDAVVKYDISNLEEILLENKDVRFCVTMLSRENQYELTVLSRKFQNLMLFGNWWFLNSDIFINEITRMRMNLLGTSFVPQHSDARVLEHLIYKWKHTNKIFIDILFDYFKSLMDNNYNLTEELIETTIYDFYNAEIINIIKDNKCITY
jgi:hypothetical protein